MRANCYRNKDHLMEPKYRDSTEPGSGLGPGPQKHLALCLSFIIPVFLSPSPFLPSHPLPLSSSSFFLSLLSLSPPLSLSEKQPPSAPAFMHNQFKPLEEGLNLRAPFSICQRAVVTDHTQICGQCCNTQPFPRGRRAE